MGSRKNSQLTTTQMSIKLKWNLDIISFRLKINHQNRLVHVVKGYQVTHVKKD